jgi:chaperonin GroES
MLKPNEDRIFLKPIPPETKTASGLIIPIEAQKVALWEVLSVGPVIGNCKKCGAEKVQELKPGMLVLINENAGMDFTYENETYRVVRFNDIHAYDDKK